MVFIKKLVIILEVSPNNVESLGDKVYSMSRVAKRDFFSPAGSAVGDGRSSGATVIDSLD